MRKIMFLLLVMAGIFLAIQLIPGGLPENKSTEATHISHSGLLTGDVSPILKTSCFDCHSNQTRYPWYSKMAPSSWFLAKHIKNGRKAMNFSEWETYSKRDKIGLLEEISDEVESGDMPLKSYLLIHHNAKLNDSKKKVISDWTEITTEKLLE